jgi:hypothetical protein
MTLGASAGFNLASLGTLTTAGVTAPQQSTGVNTTFQVTVTGIGTNVVMRFEGSLDGVGYFNLAAGGADFTLTANGVYGYALFAPVQFVRARLVSASGGTPSVAVVAGTI